MDRQVLYDRILGSLAGACIGDALGAPTEQRSRGQIQQLWGSRIETFVDPPEDALYAAGRRAGQMTDDSSQLLRLADAYVANGGVLTAAGVAAMLTDWSTTEYFPRFAGPSTRRAIDALREGADPEIQGAAGTGSEGTTNGAAMRVAPAGLRHPGDPDSACRDALTSCRPSHLTTTGVAGAAAIAAAVSVAMVPGAGLLAVVDAARRGAAEGARLGRLHGRDAPGPDVARRIDLAVSEAVHAPSFDAAVDAVASTVGTGLPMAEAVPAVVGIFLAAEGDPFLCCVGGANAGDDTDTVACMAGALSGAFRGFGAIPPQLYSAVVQVNQLDLEARAHAFTELVLKDLDR